MKKVIFIICLVFAGMQVSNAQIDFGLKGGINYNSDSFQEVSTDVLAGAESRTGFHAGIWTRFKIPAIGLYLRPELVYTSLKSDLRAKNSTATGTYNFQKIDVPVLLGKKVFGVAHIFAGPSFQYIIDGDFNISDVATDITTDASGLTVGLQLGAGVEFGKFGLDVRWERAFSDVESSLVGATGLSNFDTRVNQIIVGLSLKL